MSKSLQGVFYDEHQDYVTGSPHLKHRHLNASLLALVFGAVDGATDAGLPADLLEIGAGDGSLTEPLLANGLRVTSTEMSAASIASMSRRFARNDRFRGLHDPGGSLAILGEERFSCILFASVLHHIPDYIGAIADAVDSHLLAGGSLVSIQDPLWYPRAGRGARAATSAAYLSWRIAQGGIGRGLRTKLRRATSGLSEAEPSDMVEYHVVRDGVDEDAIVDSLRPSFESVELRRYWSTQGAPQQWAGEAMRLANTFAVVARGYRPR